MRLWPAWTNGYHKRIKSKNVLEQLCKKMKHRAKAIDVLRNEKDLANLATVAMPRANEAGRPGAGWRWTCSRLQKMHLREKCDLAGVYFWNIKPSATTRFDRGTDGQTLR